MSRQQTMRIEGAAGAVPAGWIAGFRPIRPILGSRGTHAAQVDRSLCFRPFPGEIGRTSRTGVDVFRGCSPGVWSLAVGRNSEFRSQGASW